MVEVLPLQHHAQLTVIQALLDHLDNIDENQIKYILKLFQTQSFTPVSEQVLKRLVTYYPHKLTNQILTALVPPHIRQLNLKSCTSVSFKGLSETLKKCKHLQFLDLTQCSCLMLPDLFTYAGLISPSLTSITVEHCDTVTDEVVQAMLQGISALRHLSVSGCLNLTDKVFLLNEKLQGTREAFSSVRSVMDMDYECHLVSVDVSGCRKLTSTAIRHLCTLCGPTLKSVNISWILADCTALLYLSGYDHLAVSCVLSIFDVAQQTKSKDKFSHILQEILQELHNLANNYSSEPRAEMLRKLVTAKGEVDSASSSTLSAKTQVKISDVNSIPIEEEEEKTLNALKNQDANFIKPSSSEDQIEGSDTKQILQAENLRLSPFEDSTNANCFMKKQMTSCLENDGCTGLYHFHEEKVQLKVNVGERDSVLVTLSDQHCEMKELINLDVNYAGTTQMNGASHANAGTTQMDGTSQANAGTTQMDGTSQANGGTTQMDGTSQANGGTIQMDGTSQANGGTTQMDGTSQANAGTTQVDETSQANGGTIQMDGTSQANGGTTQMDGTSQANAGTTQMDETSQANGGTTQMDGTSQANGGTIQMDGVSQANAGTAQMDGTSQANAGTTQMNGTSQANGGTIQMDGASQANAGTTQMDGTSQANGGTIQMDGTSQANAGTTQIDGTSQASAGTTQMDGTSQGNGDTGITLLADNGSSLFQTFGGVPSIGENITEEELPNVSDNLNTCLFSLSVDDAVLSTEGMLDLSQEHENLNSFLRDANSSLNNMKVPVISCKEIGSDDDDFVLSVNNSDVLKRGILSKEMDTADSCLYEDTRNSSSTEENIPGSFDKPNTVDCFGALSNSSLHDGDISEIEFSYGDVIQDPDVISQDTVEPLSFQSVEDTAVLMASGCMYPSRSQNNGTSKPAVDRVFTSPLLRIMNSLDSSIFQKQDSITYSLSIKELETIFKQIYVPVLSTLDMTDILFHNKSRDEFCLQVFFEINKSIKRFGISWKELSDEILDRISASSPDLHEIMLVECGYLSTPGISNLGLNCRQLQKVDLKGVSFIGDRAVAPLLTLPGLESLVLSGSEITDKTLDTISKGLCAVKLKELDLCWCEEITEKGINMVCSECHSLESLHLKKCPVTDLSVTLLAENCPCMKVLVISSVSDITDASVIYLSEHLHQLQELDISWNLALTNESVSAILKNCPRLHTACMSGLKQITAEPFLPIITDLKRWRRCQSLLRFKLHEKKILEENNEGNYSSDEEFEELYLPHRSQVYTPDLRTLLLEYSDLVNDTQLSEIVAVCRGSLQIIDYYGEQMKPALIHYKKGKQYLPPQM